MDKTEYKKKALISLGLSEDIFMRIRGDEYSPIIREHCAICMGKITLMHDLGLIDWDEKERLVEELDMIRLTAITS